MPKQIFACQITHRNDWNTIKTSILQRMEKHISIPRLLLLDASFSTGYVALGEGEKLVDYRINEKQNDQASVMHPAIAELMQQQGWKWNDLSAVAVINGPGSYTGLRVALSAAKGICFATGLPLITISTLKTMAGAIRIASPEPARSNILPLIDARRMEVFAALYNQELDLLEPESAKILDKTSPESFIGPVRIGGNGMQKFLSLATKPENFLPVNYSHTDYLQAALVHSVNRACIHDFDDPTFIEPAYGKAFFDNRQNK